MSTWHCCLISNFSMSLDQLPANPDYLWLDWLQCCAKNLKDVSVDRSSTLLLRLSFYLHERLNDLGTVSERGSVKIDMSVRWRKFSTCNRKDHMKLSMFSRDGFFFPVPYKDRPKENHYLMGERSVRRINYRRRGIGEL
ncbi:hypothetical protein Tco_0665106 [Tanacetum coccineum]